MDIVAVDNLAGGQWAARVAKLAKAAGHHTDRRKLDNPIDFEGVGNGTSQCNEQLQLPPCFPDGDMGFFDTPVLDEDSEVPGVLGLRSLRRKRALVDVAN